VYIIDTYFELVSEVSYTRTR